MKLRLTRRAAAELDDILTYISARSPGGAQRVKRRIQATFAAIEANPGLGRRTSNGRLRRIGATPYPYLIFYERTADEVVVIGIRHGARSFVDAGCLSAHRCSHGWEVHERIVRGQPIDLLAQPRVRGPASQAECPPAVAARSAGRDALAQGPHPRRQWVLPPPPATRDRADTLP